MVNDPGHFIVVPQDGKYANLFDALQEPVTFGGLQLGNDIEVTKTIVFDLLSFPLLDSPAGANQHTAINTFNLFMNHHESMLTWDTAPAAEGLTFPIPFTSSDFNTVIHLIPQVKLLSHMGGGFDSHGLEIGDPNQGFFLTDADPAESNPADIQTVIDQFTPNHNLQSTFLRLTVHFSVDAGFTLSQALQDSGLKIADVLNTLGVDFSFDVGFTFGGDIIWRPDDPDTASLSQGLDTPFASRTLEQQVFRPDEMASEIQDCGSLWQTSGDLTFGLNIFFRVKIFFIPIINEVFNIATFKIADFNTPPCTAMTPPPLAHLGDANNNVSGPFADSERAAGQTVKEQAGTLYLNTATAKPANSSDTSQDDTFIISALSTNPTNSDGTQNLLVDSQGRIEEYDHVKAIYADGGGGNDSFIVKAGVTVPAEIHDGDGGGTRNSILVYDANGNSHLQSTGPGDRLEYDGSGNAKLYAGDGTNTLIGGTGTNTLVSGNGNSTLKASGPGSLTAGDGDNIIIGGSGSQTIKVGNGNNNITFGSGDSTITLGTGANTISGKIKGGHVNIIDTSSSDTDHTGVVPPLADQLILNGTANPDNVTFSAGTLNGSPAVQIDDGTASSSWSVTAQNIKTVSFKGGGNGGAIGRNGDNITVGDLSSTGVATVNIDPNRGQILNHQKDAVTVLGTTHDDNIAINDVPNPDGLTSNVAITGLGYTVNTTGLEPLYDTLTVNGNGGNDTATIATGTANPDNVFAGDFNGRLNLIAFEHGSVTVNGNWNGTLNDTQPGHLEAVNIVNGAMTSTGVLQVGSLDTMTIGPAHLSVGQDMAGQIVVAGTLGSLRVAGGTPGSITAGHIGTVSAYGGFGPVVLQITENGIQRRVEEATPANPYPLPNPNVQAATSPYATVNAGGTPSYINIQYVYESGALANPQWTARITNNVSTAADQYDLSLTTSRPHPPGQPAADAAKFNLARLDAAGVSGIRNVDVEGDVLTKVSTQASAFFPGDTTAAGIRLPQDNLAGVGVRDYVPNASIQAASIQSVAFGSHTSTSTGQVITGWASSGADAQALLVSGTKMAYSNDTFRVPFADLPTQQVQEFLVTNPTGGSFNSNGILFTLQSTRTPNAAGTANIVTANNVARGAVTALVKVVPTHDSLNNLLNPVVQSIDLRGDGGSIQTQQPFSATASITSTGPLGDLTVLSAQGINNVTAPSMFGSIFTPGVITGLVQTTGQWTDPISSVVTTGPTVPADLGRLYVNTSGKVPVVTTSTVQAGGISGELVSRGDLISQVTLTGTVLTGVIAVQGNLGKIFTPSSGPPTRLGGVLVNNPFAGDLVILGTSYGDLRFNGGLKSGRIAAEGGFVGNLLVNGISAGGAVVSGGEIGDTTGGTVFTVNGTNKGIIAAKGPVQFAKGSPGGNVFVAPLVASNAAAIDAAIDAIFTYKNGQSLAFDLAGLDLGGLALILKDLQALNVSNGQLTGPVA
jgi:hypothetical protein